MHPIKLLSFGIIVFLSVISAAACDLDDFDQGTPPHEGASTHPTPKTQFEWGSDLDPWGNAYAGERSWHYVKNTHEKRLALNWEKVGLLVPFDEPLLTGDCRSAIDYGNENAFEIIDTAPIRTSNDGKKAAVAYVRTDQSISEEAPRITGTEIRADYRREDGERSTAITWLVAYFFPSDQVMTIDIFSGDGGESMAFRPNSLGLTMENVVTQLKERGMDVIRRASLDEFAKLDEISTQAFNNMIFDDYIQVSIIEPITLKFSEVINVPSENTSILLFSPQGTLIAAKKISTAPLSDGIK